MQGATLVRDQVVEVRQACEEHRLAATGMMEALHREEFSLDGVMRLIEQRARGWHLRVFEHRIPARLGG